MASYIAGKFDHDSFRNYCKELLCDVFYDAIQSSVDNTKLWKQSQGGYVHFDKSDNTPIYTVGTENAKAFIQEYGSGIHINENNPDLDNYRQKYWNPERHTNDIVGRREGPYMAPNWKTGIGETIEYSSGKLAGMPIFIGGKQLEGQKANPVIDSLIKTIYEKIISAVDASVLPDLQRAINTGKFMTFDSIKKG